MSKEYLDKTGLTYFWGKIKAYITAQISPLTNTEIDEGVADAFIVVPAYNITYYEPIQQSSDLRSLSRDGTKVLGEYATGADDGDTLTMWFSGRWEPVVTRTDTQASISCTMTELDTSGGRKTTWTCTMPAADIYVNSYYND